MSTSGEPSKNLPATAAGAAAVAVAASTSTSLSSTIPLHIDVDTKHKLDKAGKTFCRGPDSGEEAPLTNGFASDNEEEIKKIVNAIGDVEVSEEDEEDEVVGAPGNEVTLQKEFLPRHRF